MKNGIVKRKNPVIALAQIRYYDTNEKNNVAKIKRYIRLAKKKGADIVCFPESSVNKTSFLSFNHELIKEIREECKRNAIWCVVDDDMTVKGKVYNTAILINRKGEIAGQYKKMHLMGDSPDVEAGKKTGVFKTDFAKIGIAICWDLNFPNLFRNMKKKGAEIIFCPTYWKYEARAHHPIVYNDKHKKRELATLKSLIMARAFENLFFVALCNPAKKEEDDLISYSAICTPHKILKDIRNKEGIIVEEIKINEIGQLEKLYKGAV